MIKKILLYTGGGLAVLIVLFMVFVVSNAPAPTATTAAPEKKGHIDIRPDFKHLPVGLVVNNTNDPFGYTDIVITINKEYTYKAPRLAKGGSIVAPWREFVDSDGKRFSLLTTKVTNFQMTTTTTNGDFGIIVKILN